jgi:hypothetical protein
LDISHNTELIALSCSGNKLSYLDISHNTALKELICSDNQLTTLDVSHNTALVYLDCRRNAIPLIGLYEIAQNSNSVSERNLRQQNFPTIIVPLNTPIAIDTVFYGVNSTFTISPSYPANYTINNGEITFLVQGDYNVTVGNPAIGNGSVQQRIVATTLTNGIFLDRTTLSLGVGLYEQLRATIMPLNAANKNVSWSSSDPSVVMVDSYDGEVLARAVGTATITATAE